MPKRKRTSKKYRYKRRSGAWGGYGKYYKTSKPSPLRYLRTLPVGGVPSVSYKKLRHCAEVSLDPGSNSYVVLNYFISRASQLTTNAQTPIVPGNWSTVADGVYRKCTVVGAKFTFRFAPRRNQNDAGTALPGYMGIYVSNGQELNSIDDILSNGIANLMEQPRNITMKAIPFGDNAQQKDCVISRTVDPAKFWGLDQKNYEDADSYASEWDSGNDNWLSPADSIVLQLFCHSIQGSNPNPMLGVVTIDLVCKFSQPHYTRAQ